MNVIGEPAQRRLADGGSSRSRQGMPMPSHDAVFGELSRRIRTASLRTWTAAKSCRRFDLHGFHYLA
jgi:hypothetical protein